VMLDAISRTFVRLAVTRRHLLNGSPRPTRPRSPSRSDRGVSTCGRRRPWPPCWCGRGHACARQAFWALPVLALWAVSPVLAYRTDCRAGPATERGCQGTHRAASRRASRGGSSRVVSAGDMWLVPDNYQENRPDPIAHLRRPPTSVFSCSRPWRRGISATSPPRSVSSGWN
jgi:hypothetical protein